MTAPYSVPDEDTYARYAQQGLVRYSYADVVAAAAAAAGAVAEWNAAVDRAGAYLLTRPYYGQIGWLQAESVEVQRVHECAYERYGQPDPGGTSTNQYPVRAWQRAARLYRRAAAEINRALLAVQS